MERMERVERKGSEEDVMWCVCLIGSTIVILLVLVRLAHFHRNTSATSIMLPPKSIYLLRIYERFFTTQGT